MVFNAEGRKERQAATLGENSRELATDSAQLFHSQFGDQNHYVHFKLYFFSQLELYLNKKKVFFL